MTAWYVGSSRDPSQWNNLSRDTVLSRRLETLYGWNQ